MSRLARALLALHPRAWRERYGDEFSELLTARPLTARTAVDVVRNAGRQHAQARPVRVRLVVAVLVTVPLETYAALTRLADNVLWPPSTPARAAALVLLALAWAPVGTESGRAVRRRRRDRVAA